MKGYHDAPETVLNLCEFSKTSLLDNVRKFAEAIWDMYVNSLTALNIFFMSRKFTIQFLQTWSGRFSARTTIDSVYAMATLLVASVLKWTFIGNCGLSKPAMTVWRRRMRSNLLSRDWVDHCHHGGISRTPEPHALSSNRRAVGHTELDTSWPLTFWLQINGIAT